MEWCTIFPKAIVTHLAAAYSDHIPILVSTDGEDFLAKRRRNKGRLMKFKEM